MQLQPSDSDPSSYDLSFQDDSGQYSYNGMRTSGDGQYVLIFDPEKKLFVLHQIDSTFDMNLVQAPWQDNAALLREQYPQLEPPTRSQAEPSQRRTSKPLKNTIVAKAEPKIRKVVEKTKKSKSPPKEPTPEPEEDSDGGLTIEYPDGPSNSQPYKYQSTPSFQRDVSEEISDEDEDEDAEHEEYEDERNQDVDRLKLPSSANNNAGGLSDEHLELDLEAELEEALKESAGRRADESDESEEE
jgi:hypothetical protein